MKYSLQFHDTLVTLRRQHIHGDNGKACTQCGCAKLWAWITELHPLTERKNQILSNKVALDPENDEFNPSITNCNSPLLRHNMCTLIYTCLKTTARCIRVTTPLKPSAQWGHGIFSTFPKRDHALSQPSFPVLCPCPEASISFRSFQIHLPFLKSYMWNHTVCDLLCLTSATQRRAIRSVTLISFASTVILFMAEWYSNVRIYTCFTCGWALS